jgi:hypothetical protein
MDLTQPLPSPFSHKLESIVPGEASCPLLERLTCFEQHRLYLTNKYLPFVLALSYCFAKKLPFAQPLGGTPFSLLKWKDTLVGS